MNGNLSSNIYLFGGELKNGSERRALRNTQTWKKKPYSKYKTLFLIFVKTSLHFVWQLRIRSKCDFESDFSPFFWKN